jgi:hypothetical protein
MSTKGVEPGDNVPVPDPSILTTAALLREIGNLRELLEVKLTAGSDANLASRAIIETRLAGMDIAIQLLQASADKFPTRIDEKIRALREVHEATYLEKFDSIQTQFKERDVRTEQAAGAVKIAVDAALQAQKEAVGEQNKSSSTAIAKSESATMKQIDQLSVLIQTMTKASDDKFTDVKERLTRIEGKSEGSQSTWGLMVGGVALLASLIAIGGFLFGQKPQDAEIAALASQVKALSDSKGAATVPPITIVMPPTAGTTTTTTPPSNPLVPR